MTYLIAAQRVRGASHRKTHLPCQDVSRAARGRVEAGGLVFGALADGGGSRPLSQIGARLTVSFAIAAMRTVWTPRTLAAAEAGELEAFWRDLCADCRRLLAHEAADRGALRPDGAPDPGLFACTFVAFMLSRERLAAAQVGDGFLALGRPRRAGGGEAPLDYEVAFQNREREHAGEVVWLTAPNWADDFRSAALDGPFDLVVASSDGMEKAALQPAAERPAFMLPHARYFEQLRLGLRQTVAEASGGDPTAALDRYLAEVMSDPRLDERTDDDKSMALAVWLEL